MRIEVDPDALIAAGRQMGSLGSQLGSLSDALGSALSGGIASGTDPAGLNFGLKYGHQASEFADAVAAAANAFTSVGLALEATGFNYRNADAASTIGGTVPAGGVTGAPGKATAAHLPPGPNAVTVPPPAMWYLVQPLLQTLPGLGPVAGAAITWPSGHSAMMGVTATQWRNFAVGFAVIEPRLAGIRSAVAAQSIPEGATILSAIDAIGDAIASLADVSYAVAQSISDFASSVQAAQDAIRRLLDRLSLDGLWDTVTGFLTGRGDDILREVARDVGTVLTNFQRQVKGIVGLLDELVVLIGDAASTFQKWIRPVLVEHCGDEIGNALADAMTMYTDFEVGVATGLIGTVSGVVAIADPDTWKGMAELALSVARDPSSLPGVLVNMFKEFVAWDTWSGDHPGRAAGEAAFNIGSLFVPGGPLSKTGSVIKGVNLTRRVLAEGRLPRLAEIGSWSRGAANISLPPRLPEVTAVSPRAMPPATRPDLPIASGPGRAGEAPRSPAGRPPAASADGSPGPRAPVEHPARVAQSPAPNPEAATNQPSPAVTRVESPPAPGIHNGHQSAVTEGSPRSGSDSPDGDDRTPHHDAASPDSRMYSLTDGSSHPTSFAPEQLLDDHRVSDALAAHSVSKSDFVDLINKPIDMLIPDERHLINAVRDELPAPTRDTAMQKVIPPGHFDDSGSFVPSRADDYIVGAPGTMPDRVGGAVTVAGDTAHLVDPAGIYDGLRLDYDDSPFERHATGTHLLRFQADVESAALYEVPRNSDMGGDGRYDTWDDPFTGNGFTKSDDDVIPEYFASKIRMREGAEMWEVLDDGTQRLVAVLRRGEWVPQGN